MPPRPSSNAGALAQASALAQRTLFGVVAAFAGLTIVRAPDAVWLAWAALAGVTAVTPFTGLLLLAGLVPLGNALGSLSGSAPWTEPLVVAFLAGAAARAAVQPRPVHWTVPVPALVLAIAIVSSAAVQLTLTRVRIGPARFAAQFSQLLEGRYFAILTELGSLTFAALFLEGVALLVAVMAIVQHDRDRLVRLIRMMVAGAAGAAALNVMRLIMAAVASGEGWSGLARVAQATRINVEYGDVNAAGSYFAMLLCLAIGAALIGSRASRVAAALAAVAIALALWLTSSRAAIIALLAVGGAVSVLSLAGPRRRLAARPALLSMTGLVLATVVVLLFLPNRLIGGNAAAAAGIRRDMAVVSTRLFAAHPLFGIGVGEFYEQSGDEMLRLPVGRIYVRQNAHNNFLQILAELGIAGFLCFALILWGTARGLSAAHRAEPAGPRPAGVVAAALATFLVSALFGHPLLTPACAYAFWMVAGAAASFAPRPRSTWPFRLAAVAACAVVALSTPVRARDAVRSADLDHLGYGLSLWETAEDGQRYRIATGVATIFIPGDAAVVRVPLRTSGGAASVPVEIRIRGKVVDRVPIRATAWTWYKLNVPERERSRFVPLDLELQGGGAETLHVGKVSIVQPRTR